MIRPDVYKRQENGIVKEETIDAKVRHILQTLIAFGALDTPREDKSIDKDNAQSKDCLLYTSSPLADSLFAHDKSVFEEIVDIYI